MQIRVSQLFFLNYWSASFLSNLPRSVFTMRSAKDFANQLAVHVNHLNRAIRTTTGKTTTEHILDRLANEAKALLKHTNWNVAEIGYSLGFEEPSHFNNFFKKHTSLTPTAFQGCLNFIMLAVELPGSGRRFV